MLPACCGKLFLLCLLPRERVIACGAPIILLQYIVTGYLASLRLTGIAGITQRTARAASLIFGSRREQQQLRVRNRRDLSKQSARFTRIASRQGATDCGGPRILIARTAGQDVIAHLPGLIMHAALFIKPGQRQQQRDVFWLAIQCRSQHFISTREILICTPPLRFSQ